MKHIYTILSLLLLLTLGARADIVTLESNQEVEVGEQVNTIADLQTALNDNTDQLFVIANYGNHTATNGAYYCQNSTAESDGTYKFGFSTTATKYCLVKLTLTDDNKLTVQSLSGQYYAECSQSNASTQADLQTSTSTSAELFTLYSRSTSPTIGSQTGYNVCTNAFSIYSNNHLLNVNGSKAVWNNISGTGNYGAVNIYKAKIVNLLTSLDNITTENKYATYTIQPNDVSRGYLFADTEKHQLDACGGSASGSANTSTAHNETDANQRFAFIEKDGNYYLYSVSDTRFATWSSSNNTISPLTETVAAGENTVTMETASVGNNYVILEIGSGSTKGWVNFSPSYDPDVYMNWRNQDVGNELWIIQTSTPLTEAEYNAAVANIVDAVNVTYQVKDASGSIVASSEGTAIVGEAPTAPDAIQNDYVTLSAPDVTTIQDNTTEVNYTFTVNADCPITFSSDFSSATWYQVNFNNKNKWGYNTTIQSGTGKGYSFVSNAIDVVNDNALWAFNGNPYRIHVWNKGAGQGKELHLCNGQKPLVETATLYNEAVDATTIDLTTVSNPEHYEPWLTWTIGKSTADGFYLVADGCYLNDNANTGNLGTWQNSGGVNTGIQIHAITDTDYDKTIFDNITAETAAENPKWGEVESVTGNGDAFTAAKNTYTTTPNETNYKAVLENLDYTFGDGANAKIKGYTVTYKGSDGWVNIKNTDNDSNHDWTNYSIGLQKGQETSHAFAVETDKNSPSQLWKITSEKAGYVRLFNANAQMYLGSFVASQSVSMSQSPVDWEIAWATDGSTFTLHNDYDNSAFTYDQKYLRIEANPSGRLNPWSNYKDWAYDDVVTINIPVHEVSGTYYATICYPFAVTISGGTAYKGTLNTDNSSLLLGEITGEVPAGTPAVVIASSASVTANIDGTKTEATPLATSSTNALTGTYLPMSWTNDAAHLSLGTDGTNAGFYKWSGTTLGANKAYLVLSSGSESKGFTFSFGDDDPTGISEDMIKEAVQNLNAPRYNLQGQRVGPDYKGIIIQNGKKYIVK